MNPVVRRFPGSPARGAGHGVLAAGDPVGALLLGGADGPPTVHFLATRGSALVCPFDHSIAGAQADYAFVAAAGPGNFLPGGQICVVGELPLAASRAGD